MKVLLAGIGMAILLGGCATDFRRSTDGVGRVYYSYEPGYPYWYDSDAYYRRHPDRYPGGRYSEPNYFYAPPIDHGS
jgi:hypothetical protein